jgi:sialate O-acetylesterase
MSRAILRASLAGLLFSGLAASTRADVSMPAMFSDHAVLQRSDKVPIWGQADPHEAVTVTLDKAAASTTAGADGKWKVELNLKDEGQGPYALVVAGRNKLTVKDILIGEVWLCSGQSNMEFGTGRASNAAEALPKANHPEIRFFRVADHAALFKPQTDCQGTWQICNPTTAGKFSAVGYFFAEQIAASQKTPVGLIGSYVPGSTAPAWISVEPLLADPVLGKKYAQGYQRLSENYDALKAAHDQWQKEYGDPYKKALGLYWPIRDKARQEGKPDPTPPPPPAQPEPYFPRPPSYFFNGMIAPVIPYAIRGVLWYQGESNAGDELYGRLFSALIRDWRSRWGEGDFPFLFVQLPNYWPHTNEPCPKENGRDPGWVVVREAQLLTLKTVPNTGMAVTIDVGDGANLHPPDKIDIANRLVLWACHLAYGEDITFSGPIYDSFTVTGDKVHIKFKFAGTGLKIGSPPPATRSPAAATAPGASTPANQPPVVTPMPPSTELKGFAVAGADKRFVWARAVIEGADTVTVWSEEVKQPVAVRYGWANNPEVNLYNSADLPAAPFRTDVPSEH